MAICETIEEFAASVGARAPLAGLDLGDKTIGVAISDGLWSAATPRETVRRKKFGVDVDRLDQIFADAGVTGIILGLPRNMNGSEGPRCQKTRAFARNLAARCDLPIGYWDERLSTVAAERAMLEADMSRKRRAELIDHVAASYILQGALDRLNHLERSA